jgi:hypothetical protein
MTGNKKQINSLSREIAEKIVSKQSILGQEKSNPNHRLNQSDLIQTLPSNLETKTKSTEIKIEKYKESQTIFR